MNMEKNKNEKQTIATITGVFILFLVVWALGVIYVEVLTEPYKTTFWVSIIVLFTGLYFAIAAYFINKSNN